MLQGLCVGNDGQIRVAKSFKQLPEIVVRTAKTGFAFQGLLEGIACGRQLIEIAQHQPKVIRTYLKMM